MKEDEEKNLTRSLWFFIRTMMSMVFQCLVYLLLPSEHGWLPPSHKVFCPLGYRERKFESLFS